MPWHTKEPRSSEKLFIAISPARLSVDLVSLMKESLQRITSEVGPKEQKFGLRLSVQVNILSNGKQREEAMTELGSEK